MMRRGRVTMNISKLFCTRFLLCHFSLNKVTYIKGWWHKHTKLKATIDMQAFKFYSTNKPTKQFKVLCWGLLYTMFIRTTFLKISDMNLHICMKMTLRFWCIRLLMLLNLIALLMALRRIYRRLSNVPLEQSHIECPKLFVYCLWCYISSRVSKSCKTASNKCRSCINKR